MTDKYYFEGWWEEAEKEDSPEPWETFRITLFADMSGEMIETEDLDKVLDASGYEIILRKKIDRSDSNYIDLELVGEGKFLTTSLREVGSGRMLRARHITTRMSMDKGSPRVYCELGSVKLNMRETDG